MDEQLHKQQVMEKRLKGILLGLCVFFYCCLILECSSKTNSQQLNVGLCSWQYQCHVVCSNLVSNSKSTMSLLPKYCTNGIPLIQTNGVHDSRRQIQEERTIKLQSKTHSLHFRVKKNIGTRFQQPRQVTDYTNQLRVIFYTRNRSITNPKPTSSHHIVNPDTNNKRQIHQPISCNHFVS